MRSSSTESGLMQRTYHLVVVFSFTTLLGAFLLLAIAAELDDEARRGTAVATAHSDWPHWVRWPAPPSPTPAPTHVATPPSPGPVLRRSYSHYGTESTWHWTVDEMARGWPIKVTREGTASRMPLASGGKLYQQHVRQILWGNLTVASVLFGLTMMPVVYSRKLIARHRMRRGRCPACGYPRGASANCSECGRLHPDPPPTNVVTKLHDN